MSILAAFMVPHPPMIVPEIGRGSEEEILETTRAYVRVAEEIARLEPETILIASPHADLYRDYLHISPGEEAEGSFAMFGAPQVRFHEKYDTEFVEVLCRRAEEAGFPAGTLGRPDRVLDHGTMVPLWFIRSRYDGGRLVRMGISGLSLEEHYRFGQLLQQAVEETGRRAVFVASGDLSHKLQEYGPYGYVPEGPEYDERLMEVSGRGALEELLLFDEGFCERAAECGHRSFVIMAGALDGRKLRAEALSHQDVTGVGYGICTFYPETAEEQDAAAGRPDASVQEDPCVRLARASLDSCLRQGRLLQIPEDLQEELTGCRAGTFVSLHRGGELRGCIGTIEPVTDSIAQEIINNAVSAATRDPRFEPVRPEELEELEISVDVLGEPEEITSLEELDVKRYGVIVSCGWRKGLLLPDLEGVDTPQKQVLIALHKAGISPSEKYTMQRFEVIRHK